MIQLQQKHKDIVVNILKEVLADQRVYVFGSRANNKAVKFSDLDLCIEGKKISFKEIASLKEAFSESDLPYFVDIVQKSDIDKRFYELIKPSFIELK